ncbi:hypothetical protein LC593_37010, partial [Nostoc sp. CHAB 5844]|nr:hypothetical protein [Nostoc sp. CHAB 5844]
GNFVRVSGPFVYTGGFSALVAFAFTNLVCIMYSRIAIKKQDMVFGALVLACLPISGSRTVIFICVLIGLCYLVAELPRLKSISLRNFRIAIFLTITSVFTYYSTDLWTPFQVRLQELAGAGEMDARIAKHFLRTPEIIEKVGFFGYGPGVANNQTLTLIGVSNFIWLDFFPESEPDKFIAEAGGVAYIIFFLFLPLFYFFRILISLNKGIPHSISLYLLFYSLFVLIFGSGMNIMPIFYYFFFFCLGVKAACR